jgi:aarF domain-containing kinase
MAGASFIKLGQWASTRPDILPQDLCNALSGLHTRAPAHSMSWNRAVIRREFGRDMEEIFSDFSETPVGSGTVAQVHHARLAKSGVEVAVKICHPHVQGRVKRGLDADVDLCQHCKSFARLSLA